MPSNADMHPQTLHHPLTESNDGINTVETAALLKECCADMAAMGLVEISSPFHKKVMRIIQMLEPLDAECTAKPDAMLATERLTPTHNNRDAAMEDYQKAMDGKPNRGEFRRAGNGLHRKLKRVFRAGNGLHHQLKRVFRAGNGLHHQLKRVFRNSYRGFMRSMDVPSTATSPTTGGEGMADEDSDEMVDDTDLIQVVRGKESCFFRSSFLSSSSPFPYERLLTFPLL